MRAFLAFVLLAVTVYTVIASAAYAGVGYVQNKMFEVGEMQTATESVELGDADSVMLEIQMGAGTMDLRGGADSLLDAEFSYNIEELRPLVSYSVSDRQGRLVVQHPDVDDVTVLLNATNYQTHWKLRLGSDAPLDMTVTLGVGEAMLDLSGLQLTGLEVEAGVSESTIDLSGEWRQGFPVSVEGGVGATTLLLPATTGVRVQAEKGIGEVKTIGLQQQGEFYVNEAYGQGDVNLEISVEAGIGEIHLQVIE
jgi:hypothetical protein